MNTKMKEALLCSKYDNINRLLAIHNVNKQDREDLLHNIFINAFRSLDKLRDVEKMDAWLWSITRNEVNKYLRGIIRGRNTFRSLSRQEIDTDGYELSENDCIQLANELDRVCDREELIQALRQLPQEFMILFRLHYFEGYKLTEIAQITGESVNTVKSRHRRGLIKLREILNEMRE